MAIFSILIANYNNHQYFIDCYNSLINQTFEDYEIIIVDDCSTDGSFEKIRDLTGANPKVRLYKNLENKGVGYTKRKCIEYASGEICGFVDPDDSISLNALQKILSHYKKNKVVAVYSQFFMCDENLTPRNIFKGSRPSPLHSHLFFNIFLKANHFFTFRKSAYDKTCGINPNLTSAVDQDLYLKLYETGNFKFVKKPLYYYRSNTNGVSQNTNKKQELINNWHTVLLDTIKRREIKQLYDLNPDSISNLPEFIYKKQNSIFGKLKRKLRWWIYSLSHSIVLFIWTDVLHP